MALAVESQAIPLVTIEMAPSTAAGGKMGSTATGMRQTPPAGGGGRFEEAAAHLVA